MASRRLKRHRKTQKGFSLEKDSEKDPETPTDEVLAAESLANYTRSNNSFVMDVFQAQFRSSLTCPTCDKQSNTFDPFLCVSLPIPQKQLMPVFVTVLYIDQTPRQGKTQNSNMYRISVYGLFFESGRCGNFHTVSVSWQIFTS